MVDRPTLWLNNFIVRLNPNPLQPLREPRITQLTNGDFLVSWVDSFFSNSEIMIRAFLADGTQTTTGNLAVITSAVNGDSGAGDYGPANIARITDYSGVDNQINFLTRPTPQSCPPGFGCCGVHRPYHWFGAGWVGPDHLSIQHGQLFFDADGLGGAAAVFFAQLTSNLAITAAEFNVFIAT